MSPKFVGLIAVKSLQLKTSYSVIEKFFSSEPGRTNVYEHRICPLNDKIFVRRSYPIPLSLREAVDEEMKRMMKLGIIERSDSPFCNPSRTVQKKRWRSPRLFRCAILKRGA